MLNQPFENESVIHPSLDMHFHDTNLPQPSFYQQQPDMQVLSDAAVLVPNQQTSTPLIGSVPNISISNQPATSFQPQPYITNPSSNTIIPPLSDVKQSTGVDESYMNAKRIKIGTDDNPLDHRPAKTELLQQGIQRFYKESTLFKENPNPPTLQEIEDNPKKYYYCLLEILQCFGCNYFDKQGTEKGRGGEISISQKVLGVEERIINMERQWQIDEHSTDFIYRQKAWTRNIKSLWDQICQKVQSSRKPVPLFPPESTLPDHTVVDSVPVDFNNVDEMISYQPKTVEIGDEIGLNDFMSHDKTDIMFRNLNQTSKKVSTFVDEKEKEGGKEEIEFPEDLRHFKYLPFLRVALKLNGLDTYIRQTNTLKILKIIGDYELNKPGFVNVKDGGLFTLRDLQLVIPLKYCSEEAVTRNTPILLVNNRQTLPPSETPSETPVPPPALMDVVSIVRPHVTNANLLNSSMTTCTCVLFHNQVSLRQKEFEFEFELRRVAEAQDGGNRCFVLTAGQRTIQVEREGLQEDVEGMAQQATILHNNPVFSTGVLDQLMATAAHILDRSAREEEYAEREWDAAVHSKIRSFASQTYSNRQSLNKVMGKVFNQGGLEESAATRMACIDGGVATISGICNFYLYDAYVSCFNVILATDFSLPHDRLQEIYFQAILCTFLSITPDRHSSLNTYDQFTLLCTNPADFDNPVQPCEIDLQKFVSSVFATCRELAFGLARKLLFFKKYITLCVYGGETNSVCQIIALGIVNNSFFRMQFGEKVPQFPLGIMQAVLIENHVKMELVTIKLNECVVFSGGCFMENERKQMNEEMLKKDLKIEISIGNGNGRSEVITTELNERILKHYNTFCSSDKYMQSYPSKEEIQRQKRLRNASLVL